MSTRRFAPARPLIARVRLHRRLGGRLRRRLRRAALADGGLQLGQLALEALVHQQLRRLVEVERLGRRDVEVGADRAHPFAEAVERQRAQVVQVRQRQVDDAHRLAVAAPERQRAALLQALDLRGAPWR